ncbi:MAG: radical SAM protein [Planctomycetota bacterium]|jgi:MoaA/NifB/PqqE/SkfB family radical SAM enzyme
MKLTGLHLLLTYECNYECDHCFVWSSPRQTGTMTLDQIERILEQAEALGDVEWIYFEGGEPFLYYAVLLSGIRAAADRGFRVGIVSNAYWATEVKDAIEWLRPMAGLVEQLSISSDLYHGSEMLRPEAQSACAAAGELGIPVGIISIAQPEACDAAKAVGQLPEAESAVIYRGRAVEKLAARAGKRPWSEFTTCPFEDLREPGRVHVDPLGNVHICQGISLGNLFQTPLTEICATYDPEAHPITGALLAGGPAELARREEVPHADAYADACHLCDEIRRGLRGRYAEILTPDQMYGAFDGQPKTLAAE